MIRSRHIMLNSNGTILIRRPSKAATIGGVTCSATYIVTISHSDPHSKEEGNQHSSGERLD